MKKENPVLRIRTTQILFLGENYFLKFFPKSCKISRFLTQIWKFWLKFLENKSTYFPKSFLQKILKFPWNFCVLGVIFGTMNREKKWNKKKIAWPTDSTWQVHSPVKWKFLKMGTYFLPKWPFGAAKLCFKYLSTPSPTPTPPHPTPPRYHIDD